MKAAIKNFKQTIKGKMFWKTIGMGAVIVGVVITSIQLLQNYIINDLKNEQAFEIKTAGRNINNTLTIIEKEMRLMGNEISKTSGNEGDLAPKTREYIVSFMKNQPFIDQIRMLNTAGSEVFRFNYGGSLASVLQQKNNRYYFNEAKNLDSGSVYVSRIDLNEDFGKITLPYKPVVRMVYVLNLKNGKRKFLVFNILIEDILNSFENMTRAKDRKVGFFLIGVHNKSETKSLNEKLVEERLALKEGKTITFANEAGFYSIQQFNFSNSNYRLAIMQDHKIHDKKQSELTEYLYMAAGLCCFVFLLLALDEEERFRDKQKYLKMIEKLAHYDPLTGCVNRRLFDDRIIKMIKAKKRGGGFTILFIDLDDFKTVNDTLGHKAGDEVLIKISQRFEKNIRGGDSICRHGGDEFLILLDGITDSDVVQNKSNLIIQEVCKPIKTSKGNAQIGASIGYAIYPDNSTEASELIRQADVAMYEAKKNGKNQARGAGGK